MSSRKPLMDQIEFVTQLIAIVSHSQELIHHYESIVKEASWDDYEKAIQEIKDHESILNKSLNLRRDVMRSISEEYAWHDDKVRCSFKHAVASYWYATECLQATREWTTEYEMWKDYQNTAYEIMNGIVSKFVWLEMETCWRCLADKLPKFNDKEDDG